jgi:hypothetical protein
MFLEPGNHDSQKTKEPTLNCLVLSQFFEENCRFLNIFKKPATDRCFILKFSQKLFDFEIKKT